VFLGIVEQLTPEIGFSVCNLHKFGVLGSAKAIQKTPDSFIQISLGRQGNDLQVHVGSFSKIKGHVPFKEDVVHVFG